MASYVVSKHIKSRLLYLYFILGIMIPIPSVLIPLFVVISRMGLANTGAGIVLIYTAINMSIAILVLVPFLQDVPDEIEESAVIDGCGLVKRFFLIMLPLTKPALATVAIITFIGNWNDYLLAMVFLAQRRIQTITIKVFTLKDQFDPDFGMVMAGLTVAVIPVIIIYIIFQERIVKGMIAGSLKG
jgi:raffinose/stachyose/melibiose transport system permease protein